MTAPNNGACPAATGQAQTENKAFGGARNKSKTTTIQPLVQLIPELDQTRGPVALVEKVRATNNSLHDAALVYASQGWAVFPCTIAKRPITRHGCKDASTDPATIDIWWKKHPGASIGVATGAPSGVFALDVDLPDGPAALALLEQEHGPLPAILEQRTGSGGRHLFFTVPDGVTVKNSAGKLGHNLDIRGDGGYVIVPPSPHTSGTPYAFSNKAPIAEAPAWLLDQVTERPRTNTPTPSCSGGTAYGRAALAQEIATLTKTSKGGRNTQLNKSSFSVGQLVAGGELDQGQVEASLRAVAESIGLSESEARPTIKSGMDAGFKQPRTAPTPSPTGEPTSYRLTELGNAERFSNEHNEIVRYVPAWKKWLYYDGKRWKVGADDVVRRMAHKTAKSLYASAAQTTDGDMAQKIGKWAAQSCKSSSITAMLKEAAALLAIDAAILDADPWLFNCGNCTINLLTGTVRPHCKDDWITKITQVNYEPYAKATIFESVLHTCFAGKRELINFVRRFAGYCMSGSTKEQCIFIWWGSGANGKTTIISPLAEALGDYAQTTRPETLMVKRGDGVPSDLAKLKSARLVTAAEAEDGHRLAESAIKQMTGGEKIQARALYQDWFEFVPEFKILLCTNHKPIIRGDDHAIWRRIRLIPFNVTIPERDRDKDLPDKLKSELPGILAWMVAGAAEWLKHGLGLPTEVKEATESYQSEQSVIQIFLDSCCTIRPDVTAEAQPFFQAFDVWRTSEGHRKVTQTKLGRMLTDLGFGKGRLPGVGRTIYQGVCLNHGGCEGL